MIWRKWIIYCFSNSLTQNFLEGRAWEVLVNTFPQVILNHLGMTGSLEPAHRFSFAPTERRPWSLLKSDAGFIHLDQKNPLPRR